MTGEVAAYEAWEEVKGGRVRAVSIPMGDGGSVTGVSQDTTRIYQKARICLVDQHGNEKHFVMHNLPFSVRVGNKVTALWGNKAGCETTSNIAFHNHNTGETSWSRGFGIEINGVGRTFSSRFLALAGGWVPGVVAWAVLGGNSFTWEWGAFTVGLWIFLVTKAFRRTSRVYGEVKRLAEEELQRLGI